MKSEKIQGIFWIALAGVISSLSFRLPLGDMRQAYGLPGPGFFPLLLGVLLAVLGTLLLIKPWVERAKAEGSTEKKESEEIGTSGFWMTKKAFSVLISLVIYTVILEWLGFLFATFLFLLLLLWGIASQRWTISLFTAVSVSLLSYLIFDIWLMAQLPKGLFFR